jgi:hypothetical protein
MIRAPQFDFSLTAALIALSGGRGACSVSFLRG